MDGPKVEIRNIFPTPIALFEVPGWAEINLALEARIFEREASTSSVQHSNLGGWQSAHDFDQWCGPEGHEVLETTRQIAARMTAARDGAAEAPAWAMNAWANVNRQGQGNEFHTHPGCFWSATYYVRDGGIGDDPSLGGEFEIADPRGVGPAMLAPTLCFASRGGQSVGSSEAVRPRAGMLMIFPSWLSHAVRPYRGEDVRISVAINLTPVHG